MHEELSVEAKDAVHKTKNAQQAVEYAREMQNKQLVEETAARTEASVLKVIESVFGNDNETDPRQMRVIMQRVPLLCTNVDRMHIAIDALLEKVGALQDNQKWTSRAVMGGIVTVVVAVIINLILK